MTEQQAHQLTSPEPKQVIDFAQERSGPVAIKFTGYAGVAGLESTCNLTAKRTRIGLPFEKAIWTFRMSQRRNWWENTTQTGIIHPFGREASVKTLLTLWQR